MGLAVTETPTMVLNNSLVGSIFAEYCSLGMLRAVPARKLDLGMIDRPRIKDGVLTKEWLKQAYIAPYTNR